MCKALVACATHQLRVGGQEAKRPLLGEREVASIIGGESMPSGKLEPSSGQTRDRNGLIQEISNRGDGRRRLIRGG